MPDFTVRFYPQDVTVRVPEGTTLLEAASQGQIALNNLCGGEGICGRCKMIVKEGAIGGDLSPKLTRQEVRAGYVLSCMTKVYGDVTVEIPEETWAREKIIADKDALRFRSLKTGVMESRGYTPSPLISKIYLELTPPDLANNTADHQRVCEGLHRKMKSDLMQMGLKIIKMLPRILRENGYKITATVGLRREIAEVMNIEGGDRSTKNYLVVVDMGTSTIVAHLVDANRCETIDGKACFNSQGVYGREVTGRMIVSEKKGVTELQRLLCGDINKLIEGLSRDNGITLKDITGIVCAGNTAMGHFLLGLPVGNIRRLPYVPVSIAPPPLRAAEVGIEIDSRGLLYLLPGISGWVGSDLTAGILATGLHRSEELCLLVDIGTNGEIIIGNREWLISCSASAGPALEGASVACGMRAESGAVEKVFAENGEIKFLTIGGEEPLGLCGSGIIDLIAVLLREEIIDRNGKIVDNNPGETEEVDGIRRFILTRKSGGGREVYLSETDLENVITAKAAIFAALKILLERLELDFTDIRRFYVAGAFGNYLNIENAVTIGLLPMIPKERIVFVGNTSIEGAKIAALYQDAFFELDRIREITTYYDLMGANDYIEEFQKALFLPHTDIELFAGELL
ncbi:MAG: ASKHA domain-containing protein [Spirochaetia bacterium]